MEIVNFIFDEGFLLLGHQWESFEKGLTSDEGVIAGLMETILVVFRCVAAEAVIGVDPFDLWNTLIGINGLTHIFQCGAFWGYLGQLWYHRVHEFCIV